MLAFAWPQRLRDAFSALPGSDRTPLEWRAEMNVRVTLRSALAHAGANVRPRHECCLVGSLEGVSNDIKKPGVTELAYARSPLKAGHSQMVAWQSIIRDLPEVTQPVLLLRSTHDHVIPASSSEMVLSRISSLDVTEILLENSYHVATIDNDAPLIFDESAKFIERLALAT